MVKRLLSAALMLMMVLPSAAQPPTGRGVISILNTSTTTCSALPCQPVMEWLYPTLFAIDPVTGVVVPPAPNNVGLVENIVLTDETIQQLHLRDDLYWRDGQPVTAYDVLYSVLLRRRDGSISQEIQAITITDDYTLTLEFAQPDCALPAQINLLVLPSHVLARDFALDVDDMIAKNAAPITFEDWADNGIPNFSPVAGFETMTAMSAGAFIAEPSRPNERYRLVSGETAIIVRELNGIQPRVAGRLPVAIGEVEAFLAGEISYLVNPPLGRRADLWAQPGLHIAVEPSERWAMLMFNFANPDKPRDAFDAEGNPREQGINPTISDPAVRQAIRLAIDVEEIIDVAYQGYAEPLASLWPPTSWAHDASRPVAEYDFRAAEDILQSAGWWDANRDGVRECRECTTAPIDTPLSLEMVVDGSLGAAGNLIGRQLTRIGINVLFAGDSPTSQRFDLYLVARTTSPMDDPDVSHWFGRAFDRRDVGETAPNYGSYHDESVEQWFTEARTVNACEISARRDLYDRIQDELDAQTAVIPLFVEQDMVVAQPWVLGFDPLPARPLWNIRDWVVTP